MGGERAQATQFRQVWQLLLLSLAVAWAAAATACGSGERSLAAGGVGENRHLSPTPFDAGLQDGETNLGEARIYHDDARRLDHLHYSEQARRLALLGQWEEAVPSYSRAIAAEPSDVAAYEGRAKAHHMLGEYEEAAGDYSRAIEFRPTPRLYMKRGHVLQQLGRFAQADQDYHRAISQGSSSPTAYIGMGDAHRLQGELNEAIRSYTIAIGTNDDGWWAAYYFRGVSYFRLQQFPQAMEDFQRVIVLQPHNESAYFARGAIRWLGGQCSDALDDFQAFAALSDDEETIARARGHIEQLEAMVQCEPTRDIPLLLSAQDTAWLRTPWE